MTFGLRVRWILATVLLISIISIAASALFARKMEAMLEAQFEQRISTLAQNLSYVAVYGVFTENEEILNDLLRRVLEDEEVLSIRILNLENAVIAERKRERLYPSIERRIPIVMDLEREADLGEDFDIFVEQAVDPSQKSNASFQTSLGRFKPIGVATIQFSRHRIVETLKLFYTFTVISTLLLIVAGSMLALFLSRKVLAPLSEMDLAIRQISQGNLDKRIPVRTKDEIGTLATAFNEMTLSLKESRQKLEESYHVLAQKEKLASLGELTSGIAHELRNPLSTIINSAQIVANPERSQEQRNRFAGYILEEAKRLSETLTSFLKFARPSEPKLVTIDPKKILTKTAMLFDYELQKTGIALQLDCIEPLPEILCDPDQMHQVLLNLLLNARDALVESKKSEAKITILATSLNQTFTISVIDNGPGIPPENLEKIFNPFFSTKETGTGLGLPTVFQIMKLHGGQVRVKSEVDKGTTFELLLPMRSL